VRRRDSCASVSRPWLPAHGFISTSRLLNFSHTDCGSASNPDPPRARASHNLESGQLFYADVVAGPLQLQAFVVIRRIVKTEVTAGASRVTRSRTRSRSWPASSPPSARNSSSAWSIGSISMTGFGGDKAPYPMRSESRVQPGRPAKAAVHAELAPPYSHLGPRFCYWSFVRIRCALRLVCWTATQIDPFLIGPFEWSDSLTSQLICQGFRPFRRKHEQPPNPLIAHAWPSSSQAASAPLLC
jgi:hypothetical protein